LGQSADGLGWIGSHKMDPWTTLTHPIATPLVTQHGLMDNSVTDKEGNQKTMTASGTKNDSIDE